MMTFKQYTSDSDSPTQLSESEQNKNVHLEHLEDQVFDRGVAGARDSILFLRSIRDMLAGHTKAPMLLTTKWDGSPAIFAGIHPDSKKFFVATKAFFSKNAKLNYTDADVDRNYPESPGLKKILKTALEFLPQLGIKTVWQGDVMFTRETLKKVTMDDGKEYLTFQPNTIVYAVPYESQLSRSIQRAHIGVVWHTEYSGDSTDNMVMSRSPNVIQLNTTPDVWYRDAQFIDTSGASTFTAEETAYITSLLSAAGTLFQKLDGRLVNYVSQNINLRNQVKMFHNAQIKAGKSYAENNAQYIADLVTFVNAKANAHILDAKQDPTRVKREHEKNLYLNFYKANYEALMNMYRMLYYIVQAKEFIIRKLRTVQNIGTFIRTEYGYKVSSPEGFVAVDHNGNALKLVDRLEFTRTNFAAAKNWNG
jgi:hypothetical protein